MNDEIAIRVQGLSKKFARSLKRAMWYGLMDLGRTVVIPHRYRSPFHDARLRDTAAKRDEQPATAAETTSFPAAYTPPRGDGGGGLRPAEFWALRDVNFDLKVGECLGVVGNNGAGKSTLLSILSGIYGPTRGHVEVRGKLQALIALGAGFHPLLSGRENIYINGAVLGLSTKQIDRLLEGIIAFADIGEFVDAPLKNYSSGMLVRLGFAVAIHLDPDVLLIDEILAVGDIAFQRKCMDKIEHLRQRKIAFMLVTHNLHRIESMCDRAIWMEHGAVVMGGPSRDVVAAYRQRDSELVSAERRLQGGGPGRRDRVVAASRYLRIHSVAPHRLDGTPVTELAYGEPFKVVVEYVAEERIEQPHFEMIFSKGEFRVFEANMLVDGHMPDFIDGPGRIEVTFPNPAALPGVYDIDFAVKTRDGVVFLIEWGRVNSFIVATRGLERIGARGIFSTSRLSGACAVHFEHTWDTSQAVKQDRTPP